MKVGGSRDTIPRIRQRRFIVKKDFVPMGGTKVSYYYLEHRETGARIAKFPETEKCYELKYKQENPKEWKVTVDWVIVMGY